MVWLESSKESEEIQTVRNMTTVNFHFTTIDGDFRCRCSKVFKRCVIFDRYRSKETTTSRLHANFMDRLKQEIKSLIKRPCFEQPTLAEG